MEEDQEPKHTCKLCNKSFPCGRSLGGHMRSHLIYPSDHQQKLNNKKKFSSVNNGGNINAFIDSSYGLRENPKKTYKFKDSSEDTLLHDKFCKECGKAFQSWKALFGHMKCCSSDKITQTRVDEQDSWTTADQSDNETWAPNRKKRSSRKVKRYNNMVTTAITTSSSSSFNANASMSVSEIEQEQEEVAMCLIMLSKDESHWGGLNSIEDSSNNNSESLKANNLDELVEFRKQRNGKLESTILEIETEFGAPGNLIAGSKVEKSETQFDGLIVDEKLKEYKSVEELDFQVPEVGMKKNFIKETESDQKAEFGKKKHQSSKRKVNELFDPELGVNYSEIYKENFEKKRKFECVSCNKAFHSYQALGGHRASHKKLKGCFGLKINGCENKSIGTDQNFSPNPGTADNNSPNIDHVVANASFGTKKMNKVGSHECPICFRIFSSGQALGGHKRSHLIAEAKNNQSTTSIVVQKPIPEIRDFLDLNLPAPVEEEDSSISGLGFSPWWIGSSHKHEPLLGLLSN